MEPRTDTTHKIKHRSPSYPSIDLGTAVQNAAVLYGKPGEGIKKNATHTDIAMSTMGYLPKSSKGMRALAAMISYGLLAEEGAGVQRTVRLTPAALKLQYYTPEDTERIPILQEMAVRPKIFKEIIDHYTGQLPNDATIEKYLMVTKEFNPEAVRPLVKAFRLTYQFANLGGSGILSMDEDDEETGQETLEFPYEADASTGAEQQRQPQPLKSPAYKETRDVKMNNQEDMRTLTFPLPRGRIAFLEVPAHSSTDDFNFMLKSLELVKDAWGGQPDLRDSARTAPKIRFGQAMWHGQETDSQVTVVGYWGELDGRHYVEIEGSKTGVPFDEIEYDDV